MRLAARIIGIIASSYWIVAILGNIFSKKPLTLEGMILFALIFVVVFGFILSWYRVKLGSTLMVVISIILCVFAYISAGRNKIMAVLVSGVPFLISGIIMLIPFKYVKYKGW